MKLLAATGGRRVYTVELTGEDTSVAEVPSTLFPCLVWDHSEGVEGELRDGIAQSLIAGGCRYAVCGGQDCECWETAFDLACVDHECETAHVMTTSHSEEDPDEVAFFFIRLTNFDQHDFDDFLILHVGHGEAVDRVNAAVKRQLHETESVQ